MILVGSEAIINNLSLVIKICVYCFLFLWCDLQRWNRSFYWNSSSETSTCLPSGQLIKSAMAELEVRNRINGEVAKHTTSTEPLVKMADQYRAQLRLVNLIHQSHLIYVFLFSDLSSFGFIFKIFYHVLSTLLKKLHVIVEETSRFLYIILLQSYSRRCICNTMVGQVCFVLYTSSIFLSFYLGFCQVLFIKS